VARVPDEDAEDQFPACRERPDLDLPADVRVEGEGGAAPIHRRGQASLPESKRPLRRFVRAGIDIVGIGGTGRRQSAFS
jgi:hypothetical protein